MGFEQLAVLRKQLSQQAQSARPAPQATKARPEPSKRSDAVDPVVRDIGKLQKRFPAAFPKAPAPKVALKVGIVEDLLKHADELKLSEQELRKALEVWCRGARYWSAQAENAPRVDLSGTPVGTVSPGEAGRARRLGRKPGPRANSQANTEPSGA